MTWLLSLLIGLLVVLLITVATGYFVAQEFAYMAVDRSRLAARSASGDRAAARALYLFRFVDGRVSSVDVIADEDILNHFTITP